MADILNITNKKVILRFSPQMVDQAIVYLLVKDFNLIPNIIKAQVSPAKEGFLLLDISGSDEDYERALDYLRGQGISVQMMAEHVVQDEERCTHCGLCTGICPTYALYLERPAMKVRFEGKKCVMCNMCVKICPTRSMRLGF